MNFFKYLIIGTGLIFLGNIFYGTIKSYFFQKKIEKDNDVIENILNNFLAEYIPNMDQNIQKNKKNIPLISCILT